MFLVVYCNYEKNGATINGVEMYDVIFICCSLTLFFCLVWRDFKGWCYVMYRLWCVEALNYGGVVWWCGVVVECGVAWYDMMKGSHKALW